MTGIEDQLTDQLALAALFTLGLQGTKSIPWISWIGDHAPGMSRVLSALFAALVAAGFTWQFTGDVVAGGTLTIAIPALGTILDFGKTAVIQYMMQHGGYKLAFGIPGKSLPGGRQAEGHDGESESNRPNTALVHDRGDGGHDPAL